MYRSNCSAPSLSTFAPPHPSIMSSTPEALLSSFKADLTRFWPVLIAAGVYWGFQRVFAVPADLAHLPRVPILPTIRSYISGDSDDKRIRKLILPYADKHGESIVLVFAFDRWLVHVLDHKVRQPATHSVKLFINHYWK